MPTDNPNESKRHLLKWIIVGLVVWGVFHAIGATLFINYNPWRGVVVIGSFALFLGFWLLLLRYRARRISDDSEL